MYQVLKITLLLFSLVPSVAFSQKDAFRQKVEQIGARAKGTLGVAIMHLEDKDTLLINGKGHFPMQSVFKFPLALYVLHLVDKGKLSLHQKIHISKKDLMPHTYSPLRDEYPGGNIDLSLAEVLSYTVSKSDNNTCDILFRLVGGTRKVQEYIHSLGARGIAIAATEEQMATGWPVQYSNWSEPQSMLHLLTLLYEGKALCQETNDFLWKLMKETTTGPNRIKGLLPAGAIVAHKTGTSNTNEQGIRAANNDVGIVTLPGGEHFAIVVFVSDSPESTQVGEEVIAQISKTAWEYYTSKQN